MVSKDEREPGPGPSRRRNVISTPPAHEWVPSGESWRCPACGKIFPRAGQGHSCRVVPLDEHFRDRPRARELFEAFRAAVEEEGGPVRLSVAKTRIGIIARITFAALMVRKDYLRGHILLRRRADSRRFHRVDEGPPYWVHHFEIRHEADLDREFRAWLLESYVVGAGE